MQHPIHGSQNRGNFSRWAGGFMFPWMSTPHIPTQVVLRKIGTKSERYPGSPRAESEGRLESFGVLLVHNEPISPSPSLTPTVPLQRPTWSCGGSPSVNEFLHGFGLTGAPDRHMPRRRKKKASGRRSHRLTRLPNRDRQKPAKTCKNQSTPNTPGGRFVFLNQIRL